MAKRRDKKLKDKGKIRSGPDADKKMKRKKKKVSKVKAINAVPPAPVSLSDPPQVDASSPATNGSRAASGGKEKAKNKLEKLSGFIFMCNGKTKPECFRYRVFGLPAGARADVEKIKQGMKLFLFDVELKLLYGVYMATCRGQMNLESSAFGGKFPAQVNFAIHKDCLPLHERVFKYAIKDNYQGSKFKSELSHRQVKDLLSLFRPCAALTAAPVAPVPEVAPPQPIRSSALENQFQNSVRLPPQDPYLAGMQHGYADNQFRPSARLPPPDPHLAGTQNVHTALMIEPHRAQQRLLSSQHDLYGTVRTMDHAYPSLEHQSLPASNDSYYFAENRQPYLGEDTALITQDQYPRAVQEMVPSDQLVGLEREYYRLPLPREREFDLQRDNVAGYYNTYPMPAAPHGPPATRYYNTYPMPATSHGPPVAGYYNTHPMPATSHGPPPMHPYDGQVSTRPELPVRNDLVSYYSFAGVKQVFH
ncbi:uncharacterized protein LOC114262739 [Camellia sinensis]|nr:uncharacterized protein LOC114262739 [Camellia sinensis]XP_028058923.1 uncharacterized protein LOC114262739 [Camellia sinensis]